MVSHFQNFKKDNLIYTLNQDLWEHRYEVKNWLICLKAVEKLAVDELAVYNLAVDKLAIEKLVVNKLAVDKFAVWYVSCRTFRIYDIKSDEL